MTNPEDERLIQELVTGAEQGRCTTESEAFRRAIERNGALVPALEHALPQYPERRLYLVLEALRELSPSSYQRVDPDKRAKIYAEALRATREIDDFGFPGDPSETGDALIALGKATEKPLAALLDDRRRVEGIDGELNAMLEAQGIRVCDYALFFLSAARGKRAELPREPKERDRMIRELRQELK